MIEVLEKTFLTMLGAAAMTQQKAEEMAMELKERFNLSEDEGKKLVNKIQQGVEDRQKKLQEQAMEEVQRASERLGLAQQSEVDALKKRLDALEKKLAQ
ncbi:MAG: phasin family protein [Desulfuromonadaceae bacterium]|nr:phasin family protein [Desulfuromonadaceae bacterium]